MLHAIVDSNHSKVVEKTGLLRLFRSAAASRDDENFDGFWIVLTLSSWVLVVT